ncbi:MAG: adenosylcobinamide amidohydrolase [Rhodobacteraceae bacterium CG17_big_fil_post_rev_8_21_14_2_50_63_15]|nr:adenosylcobinamide amidohydrolase [Roseovarius sp.]PIV79784.1 MAG: adenosylcobinamide amidohydrolase [Rhodobacteraceae bacterium CG17_big_fil_post_rev_8_21_14_2_50_63_15]
MIPLTLDPPWLCLDLGVEMPVLSWAVNRPGQVLARRILWREVRNADLPMDLVVEDWLDSELAARGAQDSVCFLTSCAIAGHTQAIATAADITARAVATVGLSNAESVGTRLPPAARGWGTINIAVHLENGLTDAARIEALSIATQARTAAIMQSGLSLVTGIATGTGTDCIAVAAPAGSLRYAGLHTAMGEAIGRAVYLSVRQGAQAWLGTAAAREAGYG